MLQNVDLETVCWLVVKVREFEVEDALPETGEDDDTVSPDSVSPDEMDIETGYLQSVREDPLYADCKRVIEDLNEDAQIELTALAWLGRGDDDGITAWNEAQRRAAERHIEATTADYLLGMPLLADHLEAGLEEIGQSCEGTEAFSV